MKFYHLFLCASLIATQLHLSACAPGQDELAAVAAAAPQDDPRIKADSAALSFQQKLHRALEKKFNRLKIIPWDNNQMVKWYMAIHRSWNNKYCTVFRDDKDAIIRTPSCSEPEDEENDSGEEYDDDTFLKTLFSSKRSSVEKLYQHIVRGANLEEKMQCPRGVLAIFCSGCPSPTFEEHDAPKPRKCFHERQVFLTALEIIQFKRDLYIYTPDELPQGYELSEENIKRNEEKVKIFNEKEQIILQALKKKLINAEHLIFARENLTKMNPKNRELETQPAAAQ